MHDAEAGGDVREARDRPLREGGGAGEGRPARGTSASAAAPVRGSLLEPLPDLGGEVGFLVTVFLSRGPCSSPSRRRRR